MSVHPQLTLRSRTHLEPESKAADLFRRHTSLICLICRTSIYRVLQLVPPDLDAGEGLVLPTEEWVEQEVLRSESGWIELAKQCLVDESMAQLRASDAYSPVFCVALPARLVHVPTYPLSTPHPPLPKSPQPEPPHNVLPPLAPLFPPPPFVPSHPAFNHLSAIAAQRSDKLRKVAEEQVSQIVRARVSDIEKEEAELRRQVQLLWAAFREAESTLIQEQSLRSTTNQPTTTESAVIPPLSLAGHASMRVAINDFVPVSSVKPSSLPRDSAPSALSTSLASPSFHHPRASSGDRRSTSPIAATPPSPLPTGPTPVGSMNYRDPVKRDMDEHKDIATSFKYVVDMEAERNTRAKQYQPLSNIKSPRVNAKLTTNATQAVSDTTEHPGPVPGPSTSHNRALPQESLSPKGKRKVTFDIKPAVSGGEKKRTEVLEQQGEASIFDLEDDDSDASPRVAPDGLVLPLREPVDNPRPHRQPRVSSNPALPQSLQMLRPASLPATVALRASDIPQQPKPYSLGSEDPSFPAEQPIVDGDKNLSQRDQQLARLVNVITPSHRNAWKKESPSWKLFSGAGNTEDVTPESTENEPEANSVTHDDDRNGNYGAAPSYLNVQSPLMDNFIEDALLNSGVSASLPISIALVPRSRVENNTSDEPDPKPILVSTSASYRKASYAARDRSRSLDPGALDFETIGEDESVDGDDGDSGSLSRGRRRALKILQARSTLPAEGMWRSLAT
ncbi:hypothetical protein EI94DRAFT_123840 [Lactarius quietus]|nr:hypothetical protein EI94DRAFT_123840 [Lactarius quietus]